MAATGGSPASRERESFAAVRGILFAALFVALWAWVASWVRRFDPALGVRPPQWLGPAGWALAAAGGALAAWSVAAFAVRGHGTPAPFDPPVEFVAGGPYRFVRNPMYVGAIATLAGSGLVVRSTAILLLALAFWALAHVLVLAYEEPALERRFGESYRQYRRTVGRWLPRAPRS